MTADSGGGALERRIEAIEASLAGLGEEISTRRLQVVDDQGRSRIALEVVGDTGEVRVQVPSAGAAGRTHVLVYATPPGSPDVDGDVTPNLGVAVQIDGEIVAELFGSGFPKN